MARDDDLQRRAALQHERTLRPTAKTVANRERKRAERAQRKAERRALLEVARAAAAFVAVLDDDDDGVWERALAALEAALAGLDALPGRGWSHGENPRSNG